MNPLKKIADFVKKKRGYDPIHGAQRDSRWPTVRDRFLKGRVCAVCGGTKYLQAHHIFPFYLFPERELDPEHLIPLCEKPNVVMCHIFFGHLGNFKKYNPDVRKDAEIWRKKLSIQLNQ